MVKLNTSNTYAAFMQNRLGIQNDVIKDEGKREGALSTQAEEVVSLSSKNKVDISSYGTGMKNANETIGAIQSAEVALNKIGKHVQKLTELSNAYNNAYNDPDGREALAKEGKAVKEEINALIENSKFMQKNLFNNNIGTNINGQNFRVVVEMEGVSNIKVGNLGEIHDLDTKIQNSKSDLKSVLQEISNAVSNTATVANNTEGAYDFDNFDSDLFKSMM